MREARGSRLYGAVWLLAALLGTSSAASAQATPQGDVSPASEVSRVFLEHDSSRGDASTLARRLAATGPEAVPELFQALAAGKFKIRVGDRGTSRRALDTEKSAAIVEALELLPRTVVVAHLEAVAASEVYDPSERRGCLRFLGEKGRRAEFDLALAVAAPTGEGLRVDRAMRDAFATAFQGFLERDELDATTVRAGFAEAHRSFLAPMVTTLGQTSSPERLHMLAELLEEAPGADAFILGELGRMGAKLPHPIDETDLSAVRRFLRGSDPQLLVEAVLAAGRLEDGNAVPDLIDLLESDDDGVRRKAHGVLKQVTGRQVSLDPGRWAAWYRKEIDWWGHEAPSEFEILRSGPAGEASRLVLELSKKRFFRHELVKPLAATLRREETDLAVLGCAALGHLGSSLAIPHLVAALESQDEEIHSAAWRALRRLTGLERGPAPDEWRDLIETS